MATKIIPLHQLQMYQTHKSGVIILPAHTNSNKAPVSGNPSNLPYLCIVQLPPKWVTFNHPCKFRGKQPTRLFAQKLLLKGAKCPEFRWHFNNAQTRSIRGLPVWHRLKKYHIHRFLLKLMAPLWDDMNSSFWFYVLLIDIKSILFDIRNSGCHNWSKHIPQVTNGTTYTHRIPVWYGIFTYTQVTFFNGKPSQIYQSHQLSGLFFDPTLSETPLHGKKQSSQSSPKPQGGIGRMIFDGVQALITWCGGCWRRNIPRFPARFAVSRWASFGAWDYLKVGLYTPRKFHLAVWTQPERLWQLPKFSRIVTILLWKMNL